MTTQYSEHFEGNFPIYNFCLPYTFCSVHWSSVPLRCYAGNYLSFWLSLCYSFWLLFLSCELIVFFVAFVFWKTGKEVLSSTTCVTISWWYKICKKFPRSFPGTSPNTFCGICIVFRHFMSNFLLVLQWLLCFGQIDPTCFAHQFLNG